jgi:hypothetical protein
MDKGSIQKYPCSCYESGICWIVRHSSLPFPISLETEEEAQEYLKEITGLDEYNEH